MAEVNFDTIHGDVVVRDCMIDVDGTNLESGVEILLDGEVVHQIVNDSVEDSFEDMTDAEMETYLEDHLGF